MRIGIDARLINETGVGRYIRNLIVNLADIDKANHYILFKMDKNAAVPGKNWEVCPVQAKWHGLKEQAVLPFVYRKKGLDLLHVPYFNAPVLYPGKVVITIHDLTILNFNTGRATTLPHFLYAVKRFGYRLVLNSGLNHASSVICVSHSVKDQIVTRYRIDPGKIKVTYEGVDRKLNDFRSDHNGKLFKRPYLLYVGNAYPHKNLDNLIEAFMILKSKKHVSDLKLVLVGKNDFFYQRLKKSAVLNKLTEDIVFWGETSDEKLARLYGEAECLIFPSLSEGFGLPLLEANSLGCPVICSDIAVFREIMGDTPLYFRPEDPRNISEVIYDFLNKTASDRRQKYVDLRKFNWQKMARDTLKIYENSVSL